MAPLPALKKIKFVAPTVADPDFFTNRPLLTSLHLTSAYSECQRQLRLSSHLTELTLQGATFDTETVSFFAQASGLHRLTIARGIFTPSDCKIQQTLMESIARLKQLDLLELRSFAGAHGLTASSLSTLAGGCSRLSLNALWISPMHFPPIPGEQASCVVEAITMHRDADTRFTQQQPMEEEQVPIVFQTDLDCLVAPTLRSVHIGLVGQSFQTVLDHTPSRCENVTSLTIVDLADLGIAVWSLVTRMPGLKSLRVDCSNIMPGTTTAVDSHCAGFSGLVRCTQLTDLTIRLGKDAPLQAHHLDVLSYLPRLYVLTTDDCVSIVPEHIFSSESLRLWSSSDHSGNRSDHTVSQEVWDCLQTHPHLTLLKDGKPAVAGALLLDRPAVQK